MKGLAAALSLAVLALSAVEGLAAPQAQEPQPRTTFRSNVDLVPVDVNVVDRDGRPVADLRAEDFTLAVDGKPRRIASAQFISVDRAVTSAPPKPMEYSSNAGAQAGRLVMIAVDTSNIGAGRGKTAIEAAKRFVASLNPADRIALVALPGAGPQIEFTSNHLIVQTLLGNVVGQAPDSFSQKRVGLAEALAIQREDRIVIETVVQRECPASAAPETQASCLAQVTAEAPAMLAEARQRTNTTLSSLRYLLERMTTSDTPKTLVFISEGLLLDREYNDVAWVDSRAAAAHITLFALQLDAPEGDATAHRTSPSSGQDRAWARRRETCSGSPPTPTSRSSAWRWSCRGTTF